MLRLIQLNLFVVTCLMTSPAAADYASTVLADNPIAYWRLGETSGSTAFDQTSNNLDGTLLGGLTLGEPGLLIGDTDTSVSFSGSGGYVDVGSQPLLNQLTNDFSIEAWVNFPSSLGGVGGNHIANTRGVGDGYKFNVLGNRQVVFTAFGEADYIFSHTVLDDEITHLAVVFDSLNDAHLYVNGYLSETIAGSTPVNPNNQTFNIGREPTAPANGVGQIDEVAIYDRPLTPNEIEEHYLVGIQANPEFPSNASFSDAVDVDELNLDFGTLTLDSSATPLDFQIANLLSPGVTGALDLMSIAGTGDTAQLSTDLAPFNNLVAGTSVDFEAFFDTTSIGSFSAAYELEFTDVTGHDQTLTLNLSGEVVLPANDPNIPDLIYNAATGEVVLDPDASSIIGYSLENESNEFLPGSFTPILSGVSTGLTSELAEAALSPGAGSIGFVFPIGMDITELFNFLSGNAVSRSLGAPLVPFDLVVIGSPVPEPSTYVLACIGLLGLLAYRRFRS